MTAFLFATRNFYQSNKVACRKKLRVKFTRNFYHILQKLRVKSCVYVYGKNFHKIGLVTCWGMVYNLSVERNTLKSVLAQERKTKMTNYTNFMKELVKYDVISKVDYKRYDDVLGATYIHGHAVQRIVNRTYNTVVYKLVVWCDDGSELEPFYTNSTIRAWLWYSRY